MLAESESFGSVYKIYVAVYFVLMVYLKMKVKKNSICFYKKYR